MVTKAWSKQRCFENPRSLLSDPFFVASEGIWRKQQKQQRTLKQGGKTLTNQHVRRGHCCHRRATPSEKVNWSQLRGFLGETSQLLRNST